MDFTFTAEQNDLRSAMRDITADRCAPERLREVVTDHEAYDDDLWRLMASELGLVGVCVSESNAGIGGSFVDAAVVLEETGRALCPVPILTALVAAAAIDRGDPSVAAKLLPAIASGEQRAAFVPAPVVDVVGEQLTGVASHVIDARGADLLVVAAAGGLWAVDAGDPGVSVVGSPSLDLTRWQSTITLDRAVGIRIGDGVLAAAAIDLLRVGLALEAVGLARHCLESTVGYLKTRVQFGKPIGSFQALQHRAADLAVELEAAASTAYYAGWVAADSPAELPVVGPLALAVCTEAAYLIAADTIQLHGGIGFTWEHDAHLYFKRATAIRGLLGAPHLQRALVAERAGLRGPGG